MADRTTISCAYRRVTKREVTLLCIVWALLGIVFILFAFAYSGLLEQALHVDPSLWMLVSLVFVFAGAFLFGLVPFRLTSAYVEGALLTATCDGLTLPADIFGLGTPTFVRWPEIAVIDFVPNADQGTLALITRDGNAFKIELKHLDESAEKLLVGLEVFATDARWTERAVVKRDELQNRQLPADSFTRMWDAELNRRFLSTSFVPLDPAAKLQSGRLTVVRQLAFGGFSAVYLAEDKDEGKVVIKESIYSGSDNQPSSSKALQLFRREAKLLSELDHPQIAKLLDEFVEKGRSYLVLEYIEGQSLRDLVSHQGPLAEADVHHYALELSGILSYLHGRQPPVVHRDFTPDNLILGKDGRLHLVDFGAANELLENATGTFIGKQCYMAPEQVRGKAECASDYYALGGTLHFLLTGKDPEPLLPCSPKAFNENISDELDNLVESLTQLEICDRIICADEIVRVCSPAVIADVSTVCDKPIRISAP